MTAQVGGSVTDAPPDPGSAAGAVETLRAELDILFTTIDHIDQKVAVVPAAIGALAALTLGQQVAVRSVDPALERRPEAAVAPPPRTAETTDGPPDGS